MKKRKVYICYDSDLADNPRVQSAEKRLAVALTERKADVYTVRLPSAPGGGKQGADDFLKANGKRAFTKLIREAKPINLAEIMGGASGKPILQWFNDLEVRDVTWLWTNRIARGMLNGLVGDPAQGKSTLALEIAAKGSRGREPYTDAKCEPFSTLYLSNENDHRVASKPRFLAMGGDERKIAAFDQSGT